ncbi:MAG: amidohydrolase family protein [Armatimonadetes bacterium]|nr:amidohydrolase family protein [Armatimonadota bacterium]
MDDWLRPLAVVIDGQLEFGLEVLVSPDRVVEAIRSSSRPPSSFVLSPAFVNAHSHLEYRGMQDQIPHPEYYEWIYELTRLKPLESPAFVREQCRLAARENRRSGVAWIGEHSDRPGSAEAMLEADLGGWIFHEVITSGSPDVDARLAELNAKLANSAKLLSQSTNRDTPFTREGSVSGTNRESTDSLGHSALSTPHSALTDTPNSPNDTADCQPPTANSLIGTSLNPHAYFTVARDVLRELGANQQPSSIHVAETVHESNFTRTGTGPIADRRRSYGVPFDIYGQSVVEVLDDLGVLRPGMQCVHCCDVDARDIEIMAARGVTVAHCPRSNVRLQCPPAPVREMLDAGLIIGLGMDSPASGGAIDMFAEMRAALKVSRERGAPVSAVEVWRMATGDGYRSFGEPGNTAWGIYPGSSTPLIRISIDDAKTIDEVIEHGRVSL